MKFVVSWHEKSEANMDYFCLPSFHERALRVLCEAISCGLPVVCSGVCDNLIYVRKREYVFFLCGLILWKILRTNRFGFSPIRTRLNG